MSNNAPRWVIGDDNNEEPYNKLMFGVLLDAICKSIMTNDPESDRVLQSPAAMANMIEAREWLMGSTNDDLSRNFYLSGLSISEDAIIESLRHLWLRQEKNMRTTIGRHLKAARGGKERQIRAIKTHKLAITALEVFNRSNMWVGVV